MTVPPLTGSITALVTPFADGRIDQDAYAALIERQIAHGTRGLVAVGTTGESATLSHDEHVLALRLCVEAAGGRVPVVASAGSNATSEAIALAHAAEEAGADAVMAVTGYYNRPSQDGLRAHYEALAAATPLPIILYNVPARTVADLLPATVIALSELPNVVALKDASNDLGRCAEHHARCAEGFVLLSGDDPNAVGFNAMGGAGCISVTANVAPKLCAEQQTACARGDYAAARSVQDRLIGLHRALFSDASPAPTKYALSRLGLCSEDVRLPLVAASKGSRNAVDRALAALGLT